MQGQRLDAGTVAEIKDWSHQSGGCSVILDHLCFFPVCNEIVNRVPFTRLHETQVTDAVFCESDQAFAERRQMDSISNGDAFAARLVFTRSHCLGRDKQIM